MEFSSNLRLCQYENVLFSPFAFVHSSQGGGVHSLEVTVSNSFVNSITRGYLMMLDSKFPKVPQSMLDFILIPFTKIFSPLRSINQDQAML
ncbi:hypothetical protein CEXT_549141 [Caerostris extrusa]|uniref:Uncharacterized protein n=1 Tax=Caerostris extrusa TaxID=172846 RepID=A0AAV4Y3X9_CAEEX|nr:hypothetical protein CEXT_549141 [Caerostris extrusa]